MELIICPKSRNLVNKEDCVALQNLSKPMAEYFARKICPTVCGCPNETLCTVFEIGWQAVGEFVSTLQED
jgi:hypothetical protein